MLEMAQIDSKNVFEKVTYYLWCEYRQTFYFSSIQIEFVFIFY